MRLIKKNLNEDFHKEVSQIVCLFWTFIITYTSWIVLDVLFLFDDFKGLTSFFGSCLTFVLLPIWTTYMPILIVMVIQFKNVVSTRQMINHVN